MVILLPEYYTFCSKIRQLLSPVVAVDQQGEYLQGYYKISNWSLS